MKKKQKYFRIFIFILVFCFTFILRAHNYERTPTPEHLDEMLYAWSGLYLIETGVPISWSTLDYPKRAEYFKGRIAFRGGRPDTHVTLYRPWLDEPPLFSIIVGEFAHFYDAQRTEFVPSSYIRMPVIIFVTVTSILVFLIARLVSGYWMGILSMLIFGTVPIFVFGSRTAMPENLIMMLLTLLVYLFLKFQKKFHLFYILPVPLIIGIAGLSKPTGFLLLPFALFLNFLILYKKEPLKKIIKICIYLVIATLPFIGFYFWYGLHFDSEIFWRINSIQSNRPVGFSSLAWFFISPAFDTSSILKDSWYVFCLLSAAYFMFAKIEDNKKIIIFALVYWILVVMISGGEGDLLPWYRYPTFPFLAIIGAWGLQLLISKADFFAQFLVVGLLLGSKHLLVNAFRPNISALNYRLLTLSLLSPSIFNFIFKKSWLETISRIIIISVIGVGIYLNSIYIYNQYEIVCESKTCPFVPSTFLSSIHFPIIWRLFVLGEPTYR